MKEETIKELAKAAEKAFIKYEYHAMRNSAGLSPDERIKAREEFEIAKAELLEAEFKLNSAVNPASSTIITRIEP